MAVYSLVPARSGSKGVPLKNLRLVAGKSLLLRAIESGSLARHGARIYVSSDSMEILDVACREGAIPHRRNPESSGDTATAAQVVEDFIEGKLLDPSDVLIYLQPTSPMRSIRHVDAAFDRFLASGRRPLVSVRAVSEHPAKMLKIERDSVIPLLTDFSPTHNRQELEPVYIPNGAIYIFTVKDFLRNHSFPIVGSEPFFMDELESLDIDTEVDLRVANFLLGEVEKGVLNG